MPGNDHKKSPVLAPARCHRLPRQTVSSDVEREISTSLSTTPWRTTAASSGVTQKGVVHLRPSARATSTTWARSATSYRSSRPPTPPSAWWWRASAAPGWPAWWQTQPFLQRSGGAAAGAAAPPAPPRTEALLRRTYVLFDDYRQLASGLSDDFTAAVLDCRDAGALADLIAQNITLRHQDRQRVLAELHPEKRLRIVNDILTHEVDVLSLETEMEQRVRRRVAQVQRDMILREQVRCSSTSWGGRRRGAGGLRCPYRGPPPAGGGT